jgi:cellulose synthase/poly-beta-1,6-N-acetylglucosamine synthase-like glycosyltransferase
MILFEKDPQTTPETEPHSESPDLEGNNSNVKSTALLIPCYKSATIIEPTLKAALKIFPKENIFVIANGNSQTPLDNTEEVCKPYGVNHLWVPIGSKIVAQFVGCYAAKGFENAVLIDDDCLLPPNFPIVSNRLKGTVKCLGYTIKSVGPNSSKGTFCQQAQDLEYQDVRHPARILRQDWKRDVPARRDLTVEYRVSEADIP